MRILVLLLVLGGMSACTSARKVSNAEVVVNPPAASLERRVEEAPSVLRQTAAKLRSAPGCASGMLKRLRALALQRWPKASCPNEFEGLVAAIDERGDLASKDRALLNALRRIDCQGQGLISNVDGADSLADGIRDLLARELPIVPLDGRQTASQASEQAMREHLQKILTVNVPLERAISSRGEYMLSEDELQLILGVAQNNCRLKTVQNYFTRDSKLLRAMETNESLIVDAKIRAEYAALRMDLRRVFDQNIRSFF